MLRKWSRQLLAILHVKRRRVPHTAVAKSCMVVANHISWLDIFVINASLPVHFVAKSEIRRWPALGTLCAKAGTIFIERVKRRDAHRINEMIVAALDAGGRVAVFPEGMTSHGNVVRKFHANLLQAAVDGNVPVQPLAIRYTRPDGSICIAASYVGEQNLISSVLAILSQPAIDSELQVLAPLPSAGKVRRDLALATHSAIAASLALPAAHRPSAKAAGLRV